MGQKWATREWSECLTASAAIRPSPISRGRDLPACRPFDAGVNDTPPTRCTILPGPGLRGRRPRPAGPWEQTRTVQVTAWPGCRAYLAKDLAPFCPPFGPMAGNPSCPFRTTGEVTLEVDEIEHAPFLAGHLNDSGCRFRRREK
jgi:hypothetical protein